MLSQKHKYDNHNPLYCFYFTYKEMTLKNELITIWVRLFFVAIHSTTPSIFLLKLILLKANWLPHLHFQTVSHGRSCPPRHQSSTRCSHWGGSPRRWCSSALVPAHWTLPCEAQSFWSHGGWRRWWKAWKDLQAKKVYPQKCLVSQHSKSHLKVQIHKSLLLVLDQILPQLPLQYLPSICLFQRNKTE